MKELNSSFVFKQAIQMSPKTSENNLILFLLGNFRVRPALYLGKKELSLLDTFLTGYKVALYQNGLGGMRDTFFGEGETGFSSWFEKKRGGARMAAWHVPMLDECNGSEEDALELFFSLLEEYAIEMNVNLDEKG